MSNSEDDSGEFRTQALPVTENPKEINFDIPPATGNEYLQRVKREAKRCPQVVVAKTLDTKRFCKRQTVRFNARKDYVPAPSGMSPSKEWQTHQISYFSNVRLKLSAYKSAKKDQDSASNQQNSTPKYPGVKQRERWRMCLYPALSPIQAVEPAEPLEPLLSVVSSFSQHLLDRLIEYHSEWLLAMEGSPTAHQGRWMFALLACLEKPLLPQACNSIRALAKSCAQIRATLKDSSDDRLAPLNLIICLVGRYFGQNDLADPY